MAALVAVPGSDLDSSRPDPLIAAPRGRISVGRGEQVEGSTGWRELDRLIMSGATRAPSPRAMVAHPLMASTLPMGLRSSLVGGHRSGTLTFVVALVIHVAVAALFLGRSAPDSTPPPELGGIEVTLFLEQGEAMASSTPAEADVPTAALAHAAPVVASSDSQGEPAAAATVEVATLLPASETALQHVEAASPSDVVALEPSSGTEAAQPEPSQVVPADVPSISPSVRPDEVRARDATKPKNAKRAGRKNSKDVARAAILDEAPTLGKSPRDPASVEGKPPGEAGSRATESSEKNTAKTGDGTAAGVASEAAAKAGQSEAGATSQPVPSGNPEAKRDYQAVLRAWLERHKDYPRRAQMRNQEGTVQIHLVLDGDGNVLAYRIHRSAGFPLLDEAAEAMVERAKPLPRPPAALAGGRTEIIVPVRFSLR